MNIKFVKNILKLERIHFGTLRHTKLYKRYKMHKKFCSCTNAYGFDLFSQPVVYIHNRLRNKVIVMESLFANQVSRLEGLKLHLFIRLGGTVVALLQSHKLTTVDLFSSVRPNLSRYITSVRFMVG